jgi:hypothetical protein
MYLHVRNYAGLDQSPGLAPTIDRKKAVTANRSFKIQLGWGTHLRRLMETNVSSCHWVNHGPQRDHINVAREESARRQGFCKDALKGKERPCISSNVQSHPGRSSESRALDNRR